MRLTLVYLTYMFTILAVSNIHAQEYYDSVSFSRYDTLRGSLHRLRDKFDVYFYHLDIRINPEMKSISGSNTIYFEATSDFREMQIDLHHRMDVYGVWLDGRRLIHQRDSNFIFIQFPGLQTKGEKGKLRIEYGGVPREADNPPWDGGFVWEHDRMGDPWVGVACEGIGASIWWPCKDHPADEPDSFLMSYQVPDQLICAGNGQLIRKTGLKDGYTQFDWFVSHPVNLYNVTLNIARYVHFKDVYSYDGDTMNLDYYVLPYNLTRAQHHFRQVPEMLDCFGDLFGKYPFFRDGYKLVETPYWGMEHQSAIAYGNNYENNGFGFDFIIVHESGHEWWGNSVSVRDHGELWIHESFTTYAEALYLECMHDLNTSVDYLLEQRDRIRNDQPVLAPVDVNYHNWKDADMYYKGTWMLHSIRNMLNDDHLWFSLLKEFALQNKYSVVSTPEVIAFFNERTKVDLEPVFYQFLNYAAPPILQYRLGTNLLGQRVLKYRWKAGNKNFNMPVEVQAGDELVRLHPTTSWQRFRFRGSGDRGNLLFSKRKFYFVTKAVD